MVKEPLTLANVKKDLAKVVEHRMSITENWRFTLIAPFTALAILLGIFLGSVVIGLIVASPAVFHLVLYIKEMKNHKKEKRLVLDIIERGQLSLSEEVLDHVSEEQIYEPYTHHRGGEMHSHYTKLITIYHFKAGGSWRPPETEKHYEWSKEFYLSPAGLENSSVEGNIFYRISVQGNLEIAYIYPAKFFTLGEDLKKATEKKGEGNG